MRPPDTIRVRLLILIVVELLVMSGRTAGNDSGGSSMTILTLNITGKGYFGGTFTDSHPASVKFTTMTYESFYGCLCNETTQVCIVPFNNDNPNYEYDARETNQISLMGLHNNSLYGYYICEVPDLLRASNNKGDNITCNRTNMPEPNCSNSDNLFTITAVDKCELGGHLVLEWVSYQNVSYTVNNGSKINMSACTVDGITSTTVSMPSSTGGGQTLSDDNSDDNLGIIIGIVVAVVFVIGIIIAIFVIRKRMERRRKPCLAKEITGPRTFPSDKTFTQADSSTNREMPATKEISTQQVTSPKASSENTLNKYTNNPSTNTARKELHSVIKSDYEIVTPSDADKEVTSEEQTDNNSFCVESSNDCSVKFKIISEASDLNRMSMDTDPDDGYSTFGDSKKIRVNPYNVLLKPKENPKERLPASTPPNTPSQLIQRGSGSTKDQADEKTSTNDAENKPDVEKLEVIEVTPASIKTKNQANKIEARKSAASDDYDYPTCGKVSSREDEIYTNPDEEIDDYIYSYTTDDVPEKTKSKVDVDKDSDYSDVDVQSITEIPDDDAGSQTYYYSRDTLEANSNTPSKAVSDNDKKSSDILDDDAGSQTYYYSQNNLLPKADEKYGAVLEKWRANLESTFSKTSQGISDSDTIENTGTDETSKKLELVDEDDKVYEEM